MKFLIALSFLLLLLTCGAPSDHPVTPDYDDVEQADPYVDRVAAEERLVAKPNGSKVLAAINAHGGLEDWYANSPLYFHFDYRPEPGSLARDTYVLNDYVNSRAVHQLAVDPDQTFGFDGTDAWSLTLYYFVGLSFVPADTGINFEALLATELSCRLPGSA